jgi:general stress protein YciG
VVRAGGRQGEVVRDEERWWEMGRGGGRWRLGGETSWWEVVRADGRW